MPGHTSYAQNYACIIKSLQLSVLQYTAQCMYYTNYNQYTSYSQSESRDFKVFLDGFVILQLFLNMTRESTQLSHELIVMGDEVHEYIIKRENS